MPNPSFQPNFGPDPSSQPSFGLNPGYQIRSPISRARFANCSDHVSSPGLKKISNSILLVNTLSLATLVSITILKPHFCHPHFRHWTIQLINSPWQCVYSFYSDPCEQTRRRLEYFRRSLIDLLLLSTLGVLPASISSFSDCLPISHCLILQEMP